MKKKLFVVSDVHGHYTEMIRDLKESGYDENNKKHLLIVCGDTFDRGKENLELYEYLKRLTDENKAIVLRGNHDVMLLEYLNGTSISLWNYMMNGTDETLADFLHQTRPFETWLMMSDNATYEDFATWIDIARKEINDEYPELLSWLESLPYYYETNNYIFTHGMIDGKCDDWRKPKNGWKQCIWATPSDFFEPIFNTEKTVVVGHINCGLLRELASEDSEDDTIYVRNDKKVIGLDTCTILNKKVNVLVIED